MKTKLMLLATLAVAVVAGLNGVQGSPRKLDTEATSILEAMSAYVSGLKTIDLTFDSDIEVITPELEKIQFTSSGGLRLCRPDKLRAHRVGGYADVEMIFDGKVASVFDRHNKGYAQFEAEGDTDALFAALRDGHGVALPGADLILTNSYAVLVADVLEAKHIGRGVVAGRECEHLAFRNHDTDWQLWVEVGPHPIPRKLVITTKNMNCAPQHTFRITTWKADAEIPDEVFSFQPPAGAKKLDHMDLIHLDELPPDASEGGK